MSSLAPPVPDHLPRTLGALRMSGYEARTVKQEMRANLIARLQSGDPTFPGIVGFDDTVLPQVERALLAGHDFVLLGERGQGKTRLIRTLAGLLDEWTPIVEGSEVNDDPMAPVSAYGRRIVVELGDDAPVTWLRTTFLINCSVYCSTGSRPEPMSRSRPPCASMRNA